MQEGKKPDEDTTKFENTADKHALVKVSGDLIQLVNDLRGVGADVDLDLPGIIFTGKQSSAKSSLVQATTGVTLPRKDETCTRCAIEVTTKRASKWKAEVAVRFIFDERQGLQSSTRFPETKVVVVSSLKDESHEAELPVAIIKAQTFLLNPQAYFNEVKEGKICSRRDAEFELKFTKNHVCVTIEGPHHGDLSITDLPGLIQSTDNKDDEKYIDLVTDLTLEHMRKPNTVIVTCLATNDDVENQAIRKHARTCDPHGIRTLGVLTKPDLIEPNTEQKWMDVLAGRRYQTSLGYYVVRTPKQSELDKGEVDVSAVEGGFFEGHDIGKAFIELASKRCGADNLRGQLSRMLKERIAAQLPGIQTDLVNQLRTARSQLEDLGPFVTEEDAKAFTTKLLDQFEKRVETAVLSKDQPAEWFRCFRKLGSKFRRDLESFTPVFKVCSIATLEQALKDAVDSREPKDLQFAIAEYDRLQEQLMASTSQGKANVPAISQLHKTACDLYNQTRTHVQGHDVSETIHSISSTLEAIEANRGRELPLPGAASYKAFSAMVVQHIRQWKAPALDFVWRSQELLEKLVAGVIDETMCNQPKLRSTVISLAQKEISVLTESCLNEIKRAHSLQEEPEAFSTYNETYLKNVMTEKAQELHKQKDARIVDINLLQPQKQEQLRSLLREMGTTFEDIRSHHDPSADTAIYTMSMAYAYYTLAYQQFSDQVPKDIDGRLSRCFTGTIKAKLMESLKLLDSSPKSIFELVAPDEALLGKQSDINAKIKRQERAQKLIDNFMKPLQAS